jgi:putative transposase
MARRLRTDRAGAWYHLTSRGNERRAIYRDDRDRQHFLELLPRWSERFRLRLHVFGLMDNHYHLLAEFTEANLSQAMQWINVSYAVWFNRRHQRVGHLFQGRFNEVVVDPDTWALALSRYIHLNPLFLQRFGLDKVSRRRRHQGAGERPPPELIRARLKLLREYRWSSYRAYAGYEPAPAWLEMNRVLASGGGRPNERVQQYRQYCQSAVSEGYVERPWVGLVGRLILGSSEFVEQWREQTPERDRTAVQVMLGKRPDFAQVKRAVEQLKGEAWGSFQDRRGDWGRDLGLYLGQELAGMKLVDLQQAISAGSLMAVSVALRRFRQRLIQDAWLRTMVAQARMVLETASTEDRGV